MNNNMFPRLLPIEIKFFSGESPSPSKLNGIFNYFHSAFYVLESFLGNGIDFRVESDADRRMLFNISNAIGSAGKIYKPSNKLISLFNIYRSFGMINNNLGVNLLTGSSDVLHEHHIGMSTITDDYIHAFEDGEQTLHILQPVNIPVDLALEGNWYLGMETRGAATIKVHLEDYNFMTINITPGQSLQGSELSTHRKYLLDENSNRYISHIEIIPDNDTAFFEFISLYLVKASDSLIEYGQAGETAEKPFNIAYAMDIENPTKWEVKKPCLNANVCTKRTSNYCIGNTYDVYTRVPGVQPVGRPVCGGDYASDVTIPDSLVPENGLKYDPDLETLVYTMQSPLLMLSRPYLVKFAPYAIHNETSGNTLPKNQVVVYDSQAGGGSGNAIKYNIPVQSAGRPDMVFVNDSEMELTPSASRIVLIGGVYGITNFMYDLLKCMTETEPRRVAVYAD